MTDQSALPPAALERLAPLRGAATEAVEATIALWPLAERQALASAGLLELDSGDLTAHGRELLER